MYHHIIHQMLRKEKQFKIKQECVVFLLIIIKPAITVITTERTYFTLPVMIIEDKRIKYVNNCNNNNDAKIKLPLKIVLKILFLAVCFNI